MNERTQTVTELNLQWIALGGTLAQRFEGLHLSLEIFH
jgi:hypothetical protein